MSDPAENAAAAPGGALPAADPADDWQRLYDEARSARDYPHFARLVRRRKRLLREGPFAHPKTVRLAILGSATTEVVAAPLQLAIESRGLGCAVYEAPYGTFAAEMLDPSAGLLDFAPDVTLVTTTPLLLSPRPGPLDGAETARGFAEEAARTLLALCEHYHARTGSEIVLDNFHALPHSPLGSYGARLPGGPDNFIARVNLELAERAPEYVHINDVWGLSTHLGVRAWHDARYWYHAKQAVSFDCLVPYVRGVAGVVSALYGKALKCLVLDLDNTLWGGVVGDDGVDGIRLGEGDAAGEAFKAFQEYLLGLERRGVLLAVSSKNEEEAARSPFLHHPETVLGLDSFAVFKANWDPKPDNIRLIAQELNIGLDAIGFVDDNPAEREIVRSWTPEVTVFELSEDPVEYPRILQDSGMLETVSVSTEDRAKTATYRQNAERQKLQASSGDYTAYLRSLEQRAVVGPIREEQLSRVTQLVNKSNQFNLTTLRASRSQIEALVADPDVETFSIRLADRFGDNGLIAVCWGHYAGRDFHVDQWLMSCRVLKRGVEDLTCAKLVERCRARADRIVGTYVPTKKNAMVRGHYAQLGFAPAGQADDGRTTWVLETAGYRAPETTIRIVGDLADSGEEQA